jgi:HK97 family phage major capsid protein
MIREVGDRFNATAEELGTRIGELEKRAARQRDPANDNYISAANDNFPLSAALLDSDELKDLTSTFRGKAVIKLQGERADITSGSGTVGAGVSAGTSLVPGHRVSDIVSPYQRQLRIRDVIGSARTTSGSVEWPKEEGFTNNARPVSEGTTKPQSELTFNLHTSPVRTLAHTFKISRQMLDDAPALAAYVGRRGTYGLQYVEEQQILTGNGTGQNLNGIIPQASDFSPAFSSSADTSFDVINEAISQAEDAELPVNAIILNKRDWRKMLGIKDGDERYISAQSPFGLQTPRLWNLPVVATNAMSAGNFLVGAFQDGAMIFDRLDVEVLLSTENEDDFVKNLATIRIESRLALAVMRPEAFIYGSL